jgi:hypothetical protein
LLVLKKAFAKRQKLCAKPFCEQAALISEQIKNVNRQPSSVCKNMFLKTVSEESHFEVVC